MLVSRKKSRSAPPVLINNQRIEQVSSFKLLGVTVTQDLSWSAHIGEICSKAKRTIGLLYRLFGKAGPTILGHLYKVLVRPMLDHSSAIWDPSHEVHRRSLERVQNFAARVTLNNWCTDPQCLKDKLDWPPLQKRRTYQKICLCRRILSGRSIIPSTFFTPHPRPTKSHKNSLPLSRPFVRTCHHSSSFAIDVIGKWNSIPGNIVSISTTSTFKLLLRHFVYQ